MTKDPDQRILFVNHTQHQRNGTVVAGVLGAETPQHSAAVAVEVHRLIAFGVVASAASTNSLATTVVVGHQVITVINWIVAGAHPGYW